MVLPVVDFLTIKNELFPVVANVFSKTSSLGIKVRGLEAFVVLCGGNSDPSLSNDGLNGIGQASKMSSASALDKNTMQERVIPLIRVIKTKEPSVALAALNVLRHVGGVADSDFVALHILPILWTMSLGPLLNLQQFQSFMDVIRTLSSRIESEQVRKLQDLGTDNSKEANQDFLSFGATSNLASPTNGNADSEMDFERLVKGTSRDPAAANPMDAWNDGPSGATLSPSTNSNQGKSMAASFSWSTPSNATSMYPSATPSQVQPTPVSRTITPDLSRYEALTPTSTQFSQALQPQTTYSQPMRAPIQSQPAQFHSSGLNAPPQSINWTAASNNTWGNSGMPPSNQPMASMNTSMSSMSLQQVQPSNAFAITQPPPGFSLPPPPSSNNFSMQSPATRGNAQPQKTGLDAYESLL